MDRPRPEHPRLPGAASCDVCVVGGGVTGLLTGLLFARAGRHVVVLEARRLGAGTTGNTTGKVCLLQGARLSRIASRNPPHILRRYVEANREGQEWLRRFCADHGVPVQERPAYTYATTRRGEARVRSEHAASRLAGLPAEWTDDLGLPFATRGGIRLAGQLQLDPMELLDALAEQLVEAGASIHEQTRVTGVETDDSGVNLRTDGGTVRAGHAVIATGMPILDRGGYFARQSPDRSYAAAFRSSWSPPGMYLSVDPDVRSLRSAPSGDQELLLVGGNGHVTGRGPGEQARLDELVDWTWKQLPVTALLQTWSAQDFAPATALPYVGPVLPGEGRVMTATGFEKWGFTNAAAAALLLSATLLGGRAPRWGSALRSWTPRELAGLPTLLRLNGSVGLHLTKDWVRRATPSRRERPPVCTHLGGVLRWNSAEHSWDCPLHGSRFGPGGEVLEGPATCPLDLG